MKNSCLLIALFFCSSLFMQAQTRVDSTGNKVSATAPGPITWHIPEDGGTPRDPKRIRQVGLREFHIQAAFEDGTVSILRHAVSRMDLICTNSSSKPVVISLHIDLSEEGKRTDYDNKPEAGMKLRDFIFIQKPGGPWQQL